MHHHDTALLVITTGQRAYDEPVLARLRATGPVLLITPGPVSWQRPHVLDHRTADVHDLRHLRTAAAELASKHTIDGVITWDPACLLYTSYLAADLNLPRNNPAAITACRSKETARAAFTATGIPATPSVRVTTLARAKNAAHSLGYPCDLLPVVDTGAVPVVADCPDVLPAAFARAATAARDQGTEGIGIQMEHHLEGPLISVESVSENGLHIPLAVTRTRLADDDVRVTGHSVQADDPLMPMATPAASAALEALGITTGASSVRMRLTRRGPRVVKVTPCLAGDLIPHLVRLATGTDLPRIAADLARGRTPDLTGNRHRTAAITFLHPEPTGTPTIRNAHPSVTQGNPWIERLVWEDTTPPPANPQGHVRLGHLVATGDDVQQCRDRLALAQELLDIDFDITQATALAS